MSPAPTGVGKFPAGAQGTRFRLRVLRAPPRYAKQIGPCRLHSFGAKGVYFTDCKPLEAIQKEVILIQVEIQNTSEQAARFNVERFLFEDDDGDVFDPVDVRADFSYSPSLLPRSGLIPPGKSRTGWLTFDGRIHGFVGQSLSYVDGVETLTVQLRGKHSARFV